jgi:hypothetical protein
MIAGIVQLDSFTTLWTGSHAHHSLGLERDDFSAVVVSLQLRSFWRALMSAPRVFANNIGASYAIRLSARGAFSNCDLPIIDVFVRSNRQEFPTLLICAVTTEHHICTILLCLCLVCLDKFVVLDNVLKIDNVQTGDILAAAR